MGEKNRSIDELQPSERFEVGGRRRNDQKKGPITHRKTDPLRSRA